MYLNFYKLNEKPFNLTPDPDFFYLTPIHKRALAYLVYGLEDNKGFITISGEVGAGKTTLIQTLLRKLDRNTIVARVNNTQVSELQLLKMIVRDFGVDKKATLKEDVLEELNIFLLRQYSRRKSPLLIIDEAQNLSASALEEIRLISNLETEKDKLIQIILAGQPELRDTLALPQLRQLKQRITVSYHLGHLRYEDVKNYINHRLSVAGYQGEEIFPDESLDEIYRVTGGVPRLINVTCDAALLAGYVENKKKIDYELISQVISDLDIITPHEEEKLSDSKGEESVSSSPVHSGIEDRVRLLSEKVDILYEKSLKESVWEKELLDRERETYKFQIELFSKMEHVLEMERALNKREEYICSREKALGITKT